MSAVQVPLYRHAWGFDDGDWDLLASAYTEDAEVRAVTDGMPFNPVDEPHTVGRAAVISAYQASRAEFESSGCRAWHMISNVLVDSHDANTARVRSFNKFLRSSPAGVSLFGLSRYYDEMVRVDGEFRIKSRINRIACVGTGELI
jgi:3-phenylpropionate/cinnamic acid dioxygenase small subunit